MMTLLRIFIVVLIGTSLLFAQTTTTHGKLKLVHARATQTPQKVKVKILEPAQNAVIDQTEVTVKFVVENWDVQSNGKHLHLMLDNEPIEEHFGDPSFTFRNLNAGPHVIRIFPVHPWHESVKQQGAMAIVQFYVKQKEGRMPLDLSKPMMVYSTPVGTHDSNEQLPGQPHPGVLVDWVLHNVSMGSKAGYFVSISVDGEKLMSMREWRPHYVQGLTPGEHRIKLELLKNGTPMQENWNTTERTITVK